MHRYRAILIDPGNTTQERPLQVFGNDRQVIDDWTQNVLKSAIASDARVDVFQTIESKIAMVFKPQEAKG